jgi:hypothetical protein
MSQTPSEHLQRAYELIQSDDTAKAYRILSDYLADNNNDADAWWLLVYATEDENEAERAIQQVLRLDPEHEQARALLEEIGGTVEVNQPVAPLPKDPSFLEQLDTVHASKVSDDDVFDDFDDAFEDDEEEVQAKPTRSSRRLLTALLAALALVLVVGALLILGTQRGSTPEPTQAVAQATSTVVAVIIPTDTVTLTETAVVPTENTVLSAEQAQPFIDSLSGVTLISNGLEIITTSKGSTVSASVCSAPSSRAIRDAVFAAMQGLSNANEAASNLSAQAIAVRVFNCDGDNALLRFITADLTSAKEYADGVIDESQFASLWDAE